MFVGTLRSPGGAVHDEGEIGEGFAQGVRAALHREGLGLEVDFPVGHGRLRPEGDPRDEVQAHQGPDYRALQEAIAIYFRRMMIISHALRLAQFRFYSAASIARREIVCKFFSPATGGLWIIRRLAVVYSRGDIVALSCVS